MDLNNQYFISDFVANYVDGNAFSIHKLEQGTLIEKFHPTEHHPHLIGNKEDHLAIQLLKRENVKELYTLTKLFESPYTFFGFTLWWHKELTDQDLVPGQREFYQYLPLRGNRLLKLQQEGIEVKLLDPTPYIRYRPEQLQNQTPFSNQLTLFNV